MPLGHIASGTGANSSKNDQRDQRVIFWQTTAL